MKKLLLPLILWSLTFRCLPSDIHSDWEKSFVHPPPTARPWVYWFWLKGNITSNGITADLEAMKRVGIGGVLIMEVDQGTPKGPADFAGGPWRELFKHVCAEAHRLGLEINMNNDAGWCGSGGPWITPELAMQKIVWSETNATGPCQFEATLPQPKTVSNYYRDITIVAFPTPQGNTRITDLEGKAALSPKLIPLKGTVTSLAAEEVIARDRIVELSSCLASDGKFRWAAPAGNWTILRLGHTPTGADNHPAPEPGRGLESDKLSREATRAMFNAVMGKIIADSPTLAGKTLVSTHIDSWETGSQNWTPRFREEFKSRRGYDPLRWLPVMTGRVVDGRAASERFLWDVRQTVSELLVQNYAGEFRRLAHEHGLRLSIEAYDGTPCDDLTYAGQADEPMAEFWSWGANTAYSCVEMSSAAHIYGKRILGAEAFTANDQEKWLHHPATIKTLGDWAFCEGINRFVFHRYALQPWTNRAPGMSMGPWGLHYERTQTWWEQSAAWHEYLARCQFLLRQGTFVADICFLEPEGSPMRFTPTMPWRQGNTPQRPRYNFDGCTAEVILNRMSVKDGRLVVPDGPSYQVLVLPQLEAMTPGLLRKIKQLVLEGATVIGPPPRTSPSLANYPDCDSEVSKLAAEIWQDPEIRLSSRKVVWDEKFKTAQPVSDLRAVIEKAKWIWHREGNPAAAAPPGKRYFRRTLVLPAGPAIVTARFSLTVDNRFELWVNGKLAAEGDNFKHVYDSDVKSMLVAGTNVLAVVGENTMDYPNPAGVLGALHLKLEDGSEVEIDTDAQWETSTNAMPDWKTATLLTGDWSTAMELGALGMDPWGELDTVSGPPYVYPDFAAVANLLKQKGVPPDFEADSRLHFIHRHEGSTHVYFVANSTTNWLQANCAFRVTRQQPELWDPLTGRITSAAAFQEKEGLTYVPLSFEPAGSMFVVFRQTASKTRSGAIVSVNCEGRDVLPESNAGVEEPPAIEIAMDAKNRPQLLAWRPGTYEIHQASGKIHKAQASGPFPEMEVEGPWEVEFRQGTEPIERLTFDALTDWAQHRNPTVKYFSGTAAYRKSFSASDSLFAKRQRLYLNLGRVEVLAQVFLNGKNLGVLWKPPFQVEIGSILRPGQNQLEIRVVNLWVNRMVGDEQLAEDSERNPEGTLKQWPQWLQQGLPSPTGRFSFTTWRLWKKDSPLQPSGLIGPVRIVAAKEIPIP
ncbi:MAG TPA: glycosyl hydrolase [Candidatus Limnocylindrales bacterium]|nr:glycosyl hydrolase [Candidatus Limnocylindrales bacterium]